MNQQIKTSVGVGIILIIAITVGFFTWKIIKIKDLDNFSESKTATVSKNNQKAENKTSDWKTYTNKKYGFEFQYPEEWKDQERDLDNSNFFTKSPEVDVLQLDVEKVSSATAVNNFVGNFIKEHNCIDSDSPQNGDHVIEKINNGVYYAEFCTASTEVYHYVTKLNNDLILNFSYQDDFKDTWSETQKISTLKQIISTFKSMNNRSDNGNSTANWKNYTNKKYEYSISYPSNWFIYNSNESDVFIQNDKEGPPDSIPGPHASAFEIEVTSLKSGDSPEQEIKKDFEQAGVAFTKEAFNIGGVEGTKAISNCDGVGCGAPEWFVAKNNTLFHFNSNLGYDEVFDKILSTFKFIK